MPRLSPNRRPREPLAATAVQPPTLIVPPAPDVAPLPIPGVTAPRPFQAPSYGAGAAFTPVFAASANGQQSPSQTPQPSGAGAPASGAGIGQGSGGSGSGQASGLGWRQATARADHHASRRARRCGARRTLRARHEASRPARHGSGPGGQRHAERRADDGGSRGAAGADGDAAGRRARWDTLFGGECIDPFSSPWAETFTVVDCAAPHAAQLVYRGSFDVDAAAAFPGEEALAARSTPSAAPPESSTSPLLPRSASLQLQGSFPVTAEQWDAGQRNYYCFVTQVSAEPITGSVAGPGPAV